MAPRLHPIPPVIKSDFLKVGGAHSIYWETRGNPKGIPVLFLHGGPGSGCSENHFRFFKPSAYHLISFDQRGAGRSLPLGDIADNTTADLISDIERLRELFGIASWCVFGGSWGSTLGLAYAEAFPKRVSALVLRGVWLCRSSDIHWWLHDMGKIFPEEGVRFVDFIPENERANLLAAYYSRLNDPDPSVHLPAARAWKSYESNCTQIAYSPANRKDLPENPATRAKARIEAHYLVHRAFLSDGQLLDNANAIAHIPTFAVHGRYDIVCPIDNALALQKALPEMRLHVSPASGHSALEPENADALASIMDDLISTLST